LTADNFNDAMKRYQYMKKNRDFRKYQADQLKSGHKKITENIKTLDSQRKKNEDLKISQIEQKKVILEESQLKEQLVNELKGKETDLITSIEKKKSDAKRLDAIIKDIIKEEIRLTQKKKAEEERIKREQELKKQQELARIEKENEKKRLEKQRQKEEQRKRLEADRLRIQEENRQKELLAKNNKTSSTPSQPVEKPQQNEHVTSTPQQTPVEKTTSTSSTPKPEVKKDEIVV